MNSNLLTYPKVSVPNKIVSYELVPCTVLSYNKESIYTKAHILALDDAGGLWSCDYLDTKKWQCLNLPD